VSGSFDERGQLDHKRGTFIVCTGKKESGKSVMAGAFAMSWPYDMVVLDIAGDDGPFVRKEPDSRTHDVIDLTGTVEDLPRSWPEYQRREKRPMILRYVPDPGSATELEDMDAVTGLAFSHSTKERPAMLLVHEMGRAAPAGRTPAHMRRVLNHNRHRGLTAVFCGPRPMTVDPLVIAQADLVYTFELNQPSDRKRVSDNIGWDPAEFDQAVHDLGLHEYLLYDARLPKPEQEGDEDDRLVHHDALPPVVVEQVQAWIAAEAPSRARE
jgi:hypothetical protein